MNEQEKREKVIKWLEICIKGCDDSCPYKKECESKGGFIEPMRDTLTLLKSQEPHVMTLEEYEAWIDTPFTERNPVFHEERTKRGIVTCWVNTVVCTLREYGKNDRCWTSRPTDEQREAIPWE